MEFEELLNKYIENNYSNYSIKNKTEENIFLNKLKRMIKYYFDEKDKDKDETEIKKIFSKIIKNHYEELKLF